MRFSNLFIIAYFRHMYIVIVYLNSHYVKFLNIIIDQQNQRCKYDQSLLKNFFYIFCSKNYAKAKNTLFKSLGKWCIYGVIFFSKVTALQLSDPWSIAITFCYSHIEYILIQHSTYYIWYSVPLFYNLNSSKQICTAEEILT